MHTAIETSALAAWEELAELAPYVDLFLVDFKHTDDRRHRELTGVSNLRIMENIRRMSTAGWPLVLRIPYVPERTAEASFLSGLRSFLTSLAQPPAVEFMLYHRLGQGKWPTLGGQSPMPDDIAAATANDVSMWVDALRADGNTVIDQETV